MRLRDNVDEVDEFELLCTRNGFEVPAWSGCGLGWHPILDELLSDLRSLGVPSNGIAQIKQKYGGLRVYLTESGQANGVLVRAAIKAAEAAADVTCEQCSAPAKAQTICGWIHTLCVDCTANLHARIGGKL